MNEISLQMKYTFSFYLELDRLKTKDHNIVWWMISSGQPIYRQGRYVFLFGRCVRGGTFILMTNFKLVILNYAALYAFDHCHIHVIFTVCCM